MRILRLLLLLLPLFASCERDPEYDLLVRGGTIYDGSGQAGYVGEVAIKGDRIAYVGPKATGRARREIDASGQAVAPGFINMLSWSNESLLIDGRGQGELRQGVTLEVMGEGESMGPLTPQMKKDIVAQQVDLKYPVEWTTLGEYLELLERKGVSMNVASHVGTATVRMNLLASADVDPTPEQLAAMQDAVSKAMEEGALGVGSSLIYVPGSFAETDELVALASAAARCGGIYMTHMRSEGHGLVEAVDETIEISRRSGAPAEIYHLKAGGRAYWPKMDDALFHIEAARREGVRITTDMYAYPAGATGLDAAMPPWVQAGGNAAWFQRLRDPAIRKRVAAEMRAEKTDWENLMRAAGGAENMLIVVLRKPELKKYIGKTLAEIAKERGTSPEEAAMDLVAEDETRVGTVYFLMSEDEVRRKVALPYMNFGSDGAALSAEGVFLKSGAHPRAYGNFARVLGRYVRDEKLVTLEDAIHRMTGQPASVLNLSDRGRLEAGYFADVVVFDPAKIQDHATYAEPHQYATGVSQVIVNGVLALRMASRPRRDPADSFADGPGTAERMADAARLRPTGTGRRFVEAPRPLPFEFLIFGITLVGVAVFHRRALPIAAAGLIAIIAFEWLFSAFPAGPGAAGLAAHFAHEWVILVNLLLLLVGFALLAAHFEESGLPREFPQWLPDDWTGALALLAIVFVLSGFLDNIAAALIGGAMAHTLFRGRVRVGYIAAIVAASNAGGAGSVIGDTTTTMMWISGVPPIEVLHAYIAAAVAFLVFAFPAARAQQRFAPIEKDAAPSLAIDWPRVVIVLFILASAVAVNIAVNWTRPDLAERFPCLGAAVAAALLLSAAWRRPDWSVVPGAIKGSIFLLCLVTSASLMPVESLPPASWQTALALGFVSSFFDNIPLTALALKQGGYDWGVLSYAVGFGGSMLWFGSSAGVAICNMYPAARSTGRWLGEGWPVAVAYFAGFAALLLILGWQPGG